MQKDPNVRYLHLNSKKLVEMVTQSNLLFACLLAEHNYIAKQVETLAI